MSYGHGGPLMTDTQIFFETGSSYAEFEHLEWDNMENSERVALLEQALVELEERGWTQHHYQTPQGQVCTVGALMRAKEALALERNAGAIAFGRRLLEDLLGDTNFPTLTAWNDHPERTLGDVEELFRQGIKKYSDAVT